MNELINWPQAVALASFFFAVAMCVGVITTGRWPWHKD